MDVPTHKFMTLGNSSDDVIIKDGLLLSYEPVDEDLICFKPITIQCPYCQSTLNQSKRIECEKCGYIGRAVDPELIRKLTISTRIRLENGIQWAEISGGKNDKKET